MTDGQEVYRDDTSGNDPQTIVKKAQSKWDCFWDRVEDLLRGVWVLRVVVIVYISLAFLLFFPPQTTEVLRILASYLSSQTLESYGFLFLTVSVLSLYLTVFFYTIYALKANEQKEAIRRQVRGEKTTLQNLLREKFGSLIESIKSTGEVHKTDNQVGGQKSENFLETLVKLIKNTSILPTAIYIKVQRFIQLAFKLVFINTLLGFTKVILNDSHKLLKDRAGLVFLFAGVGPFLVGWIILAADKSLVIWGGRNLIIGVTSIVYGIIVLIYPQCDIILKYWETSIQTKINQGNQYFIFFAIILSAVQLLAMLCNLIFLSSQNFPAPVTAVAFASVFLVILGLLNVVNLLTRIPLLFLSGAWVFCLGWFNWNSHHTIRHTDLSPNCEKEHDFKRIQSAPDDFTKWLSKRPRTQDGKKYNQVRPYPVFIVVAAGGGMSAANVTAMVLGQLRAQDPEFIKHLYAIVSVSGGSVGATAFSAAVKQKLPKIGTSSNKFEEDWLKTLEMDLLSPAFNGLVGLDLLTSFVPRTFQDLSVWDRARAQEDAFNQQWNDKNGKPLAEMSFYDLRKNSEGDQPALLLMTTSIESGQPMAISHIKLKNLTSLADVAPNIDIPLTTAALMSARFPFVSPVARLPESCQLPSSEGFVDGGYYENSGLTVTAKLVEEITSKTLLKELTKKANVGKFLPYKVIVLIIKSNSVIPTSSNLKSNSVKPTSSDLNFAELTSPPMAVYKTGNARAAEAERVLIDKIKDSQEGCAENPTQNAASSQSNRICMDHLDFQLTFENDSTSIPLGWWLSKDSLKEIRKKLGSGSNDESFQKVIKFLHD
jgi:hypothetical protein